MNVERKHLTAGQVNGVVEVFDAGLSAPEVELATPELATTLVLWKRLRARLTPATDPIILPDIKP